jgi:hypothetical protein
MKTKLVMFLLAAAFATNAHASKTILPDACGADKVKFDVDTKKDQPAPPPPSAGMARIVFAAVVINTGYVFGGPDYTTRFGMDGAWAGAASNNSYFSVEVAPGVHHFCSAVQSLGNAPKDKIGITSIKVEAGKTYYIAYMLQNKQGFTTFYGQGAISHLEVNDGLVLLGDDDGQFRIKSSKLSVFTVK